MAVIVTGLLASLAFLLLVCSYVHAVHEYYYVTVGSDIGLRNDSFLYALCQHKPKNCTVFIEPVGTSDVRSCTFELMGHREWKTLMKLRRFDNDKVVMSWMSYNKLSNDMHIGIINMFDCSLNYVVEYPLTENLQIFPALYRNGFDIFVEKNETMCVGATSLSCRVSFDMEGRQIGDPIPFEIDLKMTHVWTVAADSPDKGLFISGYETFREVNNNISMKFVQPTGKIVDLDMGKEAWYRKSKLVQGASNAHEYFGLCWRSPSDEFNCRQFDAEGKVRLNVSWPILPTEEVLGAHNLAKGEMLIISELRTPINVFRIRKINAAGILGNVKEVSHRCYGPLSFLWLHIAETEEEFILYLSCGSSKNIERDLVDASVLRLPKKDFI